MAHFAADAFDGGVQPQASLHAQAQQVQCIRKSVHQLPLTALNAQFEHRVGQVVTQRSGSDHKGHAQHGVGGPGLGIEHAPGQGG